MLSNVYPRIPITPLFFLCFLLIPASTHAAKSLLLNYIPAILSASSSHPTPPPPGGHQSISQWNGTATCLQCHTQEAEEVFSSVHYQWLGKTPYMDSGPDIQGKLEIGVNSYCINITGNWQGCSSCHVGLGKRPSMNLDNEQLHNIDCLVCHQSKYKRKRVGDSFVPDTANMTITMVQAARTVHLPNRATCLQCHAKGGGGDNFKRGDMAMAHGATEDKNFDIHMATTGGNLSCQKCHTTQAHKIAGRGSDLRSTDLDIAMDCSDCHKSKLETYGHDDKRIGQHVKRVGCQSCHIDRYARNADDTLASEKTEIHRDWRKPHLTASGAIHPTPTLAGNLIPRYRWWNGRSSGYSLFDDASVDPLTSRIPTSRPSGSITDSGAKLYPFKYKTALQPLATAENVLIALDTSIYFSTGEPVNATLQGLINMGYTASEPFEWVETDTFQLITHEVGPSERALRCNDCHGTTERMDMQNELGYQLKGKESTVCVQCHKYEEAEKEGYRWIHEEHVEEERYDCSWCHVFSRPERGLRLNK